MSKVACTTDASVIPKVFWKYFDLYRRKIITLMEFSERSGLPLSRLKEYLNLI